MATVPPSGIDTPSLDSKPLSPFDTLISSNNGGAPAWMEPYAYLSRHPGKGVRSILIGAFNCWLDVPQDVLKVVDELTRMLHNASLLIDDIEDGSTMRRGEPAAHTIYGEALTINCANYVYFAALELCNSLGQPDAISTFSRELRLLHQGQGFDIHWRDAMVVPTMEQYREMVINKTAGLFRLAVGVMQSASNDKREYVPLLDTLGLLFQIRDDYMNLQSEEYADSKIYCEDLTEGKFSFPIIHAIRARPNDHRLLAIMRQRSTSLELKNHAVQYMTEVGTFRWTRREIKRLGDVALGQIEALGGNVSLEKLVGKLVDVPNPEEEDGEAVAKKTFV